VGTQPQQPLTPEAPHRQEPFGTSFAVIKGVPISHAQYRTLDNGGHIYLENMDEGKGKFSGYVFYDDEKTKLVTCTEHPDTMLDSNGFQIRLRDACLVLEGFVTRADVKLRGETDFKRLFVCKDPNSDQLLFSETDPRLSKEESETERQTTAARKQPEPPRPAKQNLAIGGVRLTDEQYETLRSGGHIYLENMEKKDGSGKFSSWVFTTEDMRKAFFSGENPDNMVEHNGIAVRLRDKILVERGFIVKAKMEWEGSGGYQYPFVWRDPESGKIQQSFTDPRLPKGQAETERQASEASREEGNTTRQTPEADRTSPKINRTGPTLKTPSKGLKPKR
jgi:hypothetical protein